MHSFLCLGVKIRMLCHMGFSAKGSVDREPKILDFSPKKYGRELNYMRFETFEN